MDETLKAILDELHRDGAEHDAARADRLERLRNVEPDSAQLLGRAGAGDGRSSGCWSSARPTATRRCGWPTPRAASAAGW